ncbi:hypothetical protein BJ912DRAFT_159770 [Pholiota molesta]|nr:hypothetical protein BJ912DRAFT_159770 [Pholiota molesta]
MSSSSTATTIYLPSCLLLLVHLHLLEYPCSNRPEYDHNIFNPRTRGLRERARTMEEVTYYLVGKLEGKSIKNILPTYPCNQPAESLAFRTTLTKYLENLRHQCIYPSSSRSSASSGTSAKSKPSNEVKDNSEQAWWWKDVIVRKSLLEECSGDKFERLMLSLSTHALMRTSHALSPDTMSMLLRSQPAIYSTSLARYQTSRHVWTKSASILMGSQVDLKTLRGRIQRQISDKSSKYDGMTTDRLKALVNSALQELLQRQWSGENGTAALYFVIELAALKLSSTPSLNLSHDRVNTSTIPPVVPSPLPVAAAHHPAHLKRLRRPVFGTKNKTSAQSEHVPPLPARSHAEIIIAERIAPLKRTHQTLADALSRLEQKRLALREKLNAYSSGNDAPIAPLALWTHCGAPTTSVDVTPQVTNGFMASLGFQAEFLALDQDTVDEDVLEKRIDEIRRNTLPSYLPLPNLSTPRLPPRDFTANAIVPRTKALQPQRTASTSKSVSIRDPPLPTLELPVPPAMSPGKSSRSSRRKSVRFSMARRRASMFRVFSGEVNDEVDKLVDETHDFPTDDEDTDDEYASPYKTPRGKGRQKANRIWTAGTPTTAKKSAARPRMASALALLLDSDPKQRLPSLTLSASSEQMDEEDTGSDEEEDRFRVEDAKDIDATPRPRRQTLPRRGSAESRLAEGDDYDGMNAGDAETGEQDVFGDEQPSMTLKEILLSADTSYFDLLEAGNDDADDGMLAADASFVWE